MSFCAICGHQLTTLLSVAKRIESPELGDQVWASGQPFTLADIKSKFYFANVWETLMESIGALPM